MATSTTIRENAAPLKVIGVGYSRTGTLSLHAALEKLGFGPCHHPLVLGVDHYFGKLAKALKGDASPEALDDIYRGFVSATDSTTASLAEPLYRAFPEAKFILTIRDTAKWVQSMKKTSIQFFIGCEERESKVNAGTASEEDRILHEKMEEFGLLDWVKTLLEKSRRRLLTDPEGEFERHNQYIIQLIPPEQLLIFDVKEGWGPLAKFLGVPEPSEPFPSSNDLAGYTKNTNAHLEKLTMI